MRSFNQRYIHPSQMIPPYTVRFTPEPSGHFFMVTEHSNNTGPKTNVVTEKKQRKLLKSLQPLFYLMRIAGFLPIVQEPTGGYMCCFKVCSVRSVLLAIYSVFVYFVFLAHSVLLYNKETDLKETTDVVPIEQYVVRYSLLLETFSLVLIPITFWYKTTAFCEYLGKWQLFEMHYLSVTGHKLVPLSKRKVIVTLMVMTAVFTLLRQQYMMYSMQLYSIVHNIACKTLWYTSCCALYNSAKQFLTEYKTAAMSSYHNLRAYRGLWLELAALTLTMGHVFTVNFIILFVNAIASTSSLLYGFLTHKEVGNLWLVFGIGILTTTCILINTAHEAAQQVSYVLLRELQTLSFQQEDERIQEEINALIQAIAVDPPAICLGDFVTFNRKLLASLLGTLVTNLIVLLQFRGASIKYGSDIDITDLTALN